MSILGTIFGKLFPSSHAANAPASAATPAPGAPSTPPPVAAPATAQAVPMATVDVEKTLDDLVAKSPEKLNWRVSIVDLMKLLDIDSSLTARKDLAKELNYSGDTNDSASMNIWLHREVMKRFAANGGKVPSDLRD